MRHLRLFVFFELFEYFVFILVILVQLGDQDLDSVFMVVGDREQCEYNLHVGKGCVDGDNCGVEVDLRDGVFALHIKLISQVI